MKQTIFIAMITLLVACSDPIDYAPTMKYVISVDKSEAAVITKKLLEECKQVLNYRLDAARFKVLNGEVSKGNKIEILAKAPRENNARQLVETQGKLRFHPVHKENGKFISNFSRLTEAEKVSYIPPVGYEVKNMQEITGEPVRQILIRKKAFSFTSDNITNASAVVSEFGGHMVSLTFDKAGTAAFAKATAEVAKIHGQIAIVLDGVVYSSPRVRTKISGGSVQITGSFSHEEAKEFANVLSCGELPLKLKLDKVNIIGSTK